MYQSSVGETNKFSGIHLDVEPYLNNSWKTDRASVIIDYQSMILLGEQYSKDMNIPFEVDVPFWFDEVKYKNEYGTGVLVEWVIKHTNSVTIMAYRDNSKDILKIVKNEMKYAKKYKKNITIAVETDVMNEGDNITFNEEGTKNMEQELLKVARRYVLNTSFDGFAVHHIESWMKLENAEQ